ncbi:membrane protein YfhO [Chitinophaga jiangningensis]|uniref:Membrane protein YfhO n=1 Tax=Chitinophaga jiangningensis TaxID=1419482 RepID=A0A1M7M6A0_9BACT|nr:YfhO family protein [Chitinophaga jiangningensis]SHM86229.1 membrane protein YfhO [Chitinophaga jiangningensis]
MKQNWLKAILPHLAAIGIFLILATVYCAPVLEGKVVNQSDMMNVQGMAKEAKDYYQQTGDVPLWSNSMFGGMPTYVVYTGPNPNKISVLNRAVCLFLPDPINMLFLAMLCMYVLACVLDIKYWIRIAGAIAFAFCTYNVIIIDVGHITKMYDIALMPAVFAGILLTYKKRYLSGAALTLLATSLFIYNNHLQVIYYALICILVLAIAAFIYAKKQQDLPGFFKASAILVAMGIISVLPNMNSLLITHEYTDYTMRGSKSELTIHSPEESGTTKKDTKSTGLDIDYAYDWSYGVGESFTFLIPGYAGNSSSARPGPGSNTYEALVKIGAPEAQAEQILQQAPFPMYHGDQPKGTSGPVYVGAIICLLVMISFLIVRSWHMWWLIPITIIGFILSWGNHFMVINEFLFYHLPYYNKFRAPAMALIIPSFSFVVMAILALQEIVSGTLSTPVLLKKLQYGTLATAGVIVVFGIAGSSMMSMTSHHDAQLLTSFTQYFGGEENARSIIRGLEKDRAALIMKDSFRSLVFILIAAGALWAYLKSKIKVTVLAVVLIGAITIDLWQQDKKYLNGDSFVDESTFMAELQPSAADLEIKKDPDPYYRVWNLTAPLDNAAPSYFHKNIGGYSPAKLWIYQDMLDHLLVPAYQHIASGKPTAQDMRILNMLNTKYLIYPGQNNQLVPQRNPDAYGNAWFVKGIVYAPDANSEMTTLQSLDVKDSAVIDKRFQPKLGGAFQPVADSAASIKLTKYGLNNLEYASSNSQEGFAVFSDIYYPAGWYAYIDGKETDIIRTNYGLRGLKIPAGQHKIEMKFAPPTYFKGVKIAGISSFLVILLVIGGFVAQALVDKKQTQAGK